MTFRDAIDTAENGEDLTAELTGHCIDQMLSGEAHADEVSQLLLALRSKGEAVSELVGAARAMRRHMTRIDHRHQTLLDTCGTGGSGTGTFNISTTVAIVVAACGIPVAKHGNRKATSKSGSADVLECLGVPIQSEPDSVAATLDKIGLCFCFAAKLHPAMRHVIEIRRSLGVPTLFNLLGPLCNPAGATHQLLGTASQETQTKIAAALTQLETQRSFVIHADDGQDEVSLVSVTHCIEVSPGQQTCHAWENSAFGLGSVEISEIAASDPPHSAQIIRDLLAGKRGPARDTVLAGTAAALLLVGHVNELTQGVAIAAETIDNGAATDKLRQLTDCQF